MFFYGCSNSLTVYEIFFIIDYSKKIMTLKIKNRHGSDMVVPLTQLKKDIDRVIEIATSCQSAIHYQNKVCDYPLYSKSI